MSTYCTCCGSLCERSTGLPQDWNLDKGYGRCAECIPRLADDAAKYGNRSRIDAIPDRDERRRLYLELFLSLA